jgi:alkylation response protein AidB-like acyl-CoA dehydrogenase
VTVVEQSQETVADFRARIRAWLPEHLPRLGGSRADDPITRRMEADGLDPRSSGARGRTTQKVIHEGGFAGITYPVEYGGLGLSQAHLAAFSAEATGYDLSSLSLYTMTLGMIGPTFLDLGTEEQKRRYIPKMINGDEVWIQFLSEPTGGSDLASALTRADRDGDEWVINGSKIWTSLGEDGDLGLCVARTNWDVPKHQGLTVLIVPVKTPGLTVIPLRLVNGSTGFCQEFFDDVRIPAENVVGEIGSGWVAASRLLVHERNAVGGGSPYYQMPGGGRAEPGSRSSKDELVQLAEDTGQASDPHVRQLVAEAHVASKVGGLLSRRVAMGAASGYFPPAAGSILKLFSTTAGIRRADIGMEIAGSGAVAWKPGEGGAEGRGVGYLSRQVMSILSGTTEIQRNIVSERILDLPREPAPDRDTPFNQVRTNKMPSR